MPSPSPARAGLASLALASLSLAACGPTADDRARLARVESRTTAAAADEAPAPAPPAEPAAPTRTGARCVPTDPNAPRTHGVSDAAALAAFERAAPALAARCADSGAAPVSAPALVDAARTCLAQSEGASVRFEVCENGACCEAAIASRDVPERTDDFGRWVIVRGPLHIDDYEDEVLWSDGERIESLCTWAAYNEPHCWEEGDLAPADDWTGCEMTPVMWLEIGLETRRFLCQTAL